MLRTLSGLLGAICLLVGTAADADENKLAAVNMAGEGRMLSQRIAKAYAQVGLNVMPAAAAGQMKESVARFESNLERLKPAAAASPEAGRAYGRLVQAWATLRATASGPVSRETALALSGDSLAVLAASDALTQALEDAAGPGMSQLVNMAGRQRMLSQRLVKAYLLRSWGLDAASLRDELDASVTEFSGRLAALRAQPQNTPEIRRELDEIALQWEWLQAALAAEGATSYRLVVSEASEEILAATDRVTRMYEQLGRR